MYEYKFPDIGEGITEGTLLSWLVQEGDTVKEGQDLAEVETDKVTTHIPSAASGTVFRLHVKEGDILEVGKVFITIDDGSDEKKSPAATENAPAPAIDPDTQKTEPVPDLDDEEEEEVAGVVGELVAGKGIIPPSEEGRAEKPRETKKKKALATPVARKMAKDLGVDINEITGTGPGGRVMKEDIRAFSHDDKASAKDQPETASEPKKRSDGERREAVSRIRQTIAQKMTESQQKLVHTTSMEEIDVSALFAFREKHKTRVDDDIKLTYLPFILKAIVLGLKEFPVFNSHYDEENREIVYKDAYHIGIATDTERGLMVPVLFDADQKSILELAKEMEEMAEKARENTLTLEQLRGGTFSITNYGSIGGTFGTPIINYPESAILGVGRIQEKPVVRDGRIVIGHLLPLSLSYDHRIIDGAGGVRLIRFIEDALSDPEMLLLRS